MAATAAMVAASSLILLLLLLLVGAPFSSAVRPRPNTGKFNAQSVRSIIQQSSKDFLKDRAQQDATDYFSARRNNDDELGSSAASSYGALTFEISVGTSPQSLSVVMDITSELIWAQCDDPCPLCVRETPPGTPSFYSKRSGSFLQISCADQNCQLAGEHCADPSDPCSYTEMFPGTGNTSGYLASETFSFGTTAFPGMVFGCGADIRLPDLQGTSGFVGFSRGRLSLVSQLQISHFSYYIPLPDVSGSATGFLSWSWGVAATAVPAPAEGSRSTPLLPATAYQNPDLYYVHLTGVKVDGQLLPIPAGTFDVGANGLGGVFLSTTLPVTYLQQAAYNVLRMELVDRIQSQGVLPMEPAGDLDHLCFLTQYFVKARVPKLALVFDGADAVMELRGEN